MGDAAATEETAVAAVAAERTCGPGGDEARPCDDTDDAIIETLRVYIAANYEKFGASELTFRTLKGHLVSKLGVEYESLALGTGRYGDTLDDEVDVIAVRCDGGAHPVACVFLPDYVPPVDLLEKYKPQLAAGAALLAGALLLKIARSVLRRRSSAPKVKER